MSKIVLSGQPNNTIQSFIDRERSFFAKSLERATKSTEAQRAKWRAETVYERRERVSAEVYNLFNGTVKYGPFSGLKLGQNVWWGNVDKASMLLGIYEKEILEFLSSGITSERPYFIDVGAADGYYAVGMLSSGLSKYCYCFEMSEEGRKRISENAELNHVTEQLSIFPEATEQFAEALPEEILNKAIILIDIEGGEFDILNEHSLKALSQSVIIIEIHHWIDGFFNKYQHFLAMADRYFDITVIDPLEKKIETFSELDDFTDDNRYLICSEGRPNRMRFLKLGPKN